MPGIRRSVDLGSGRVFRISIDDITREPVDAIVNAANGGLSHGGGVAGAISRAAGSRLDEASREWVRRNGHVPTGEAVVTTAGKLPFEGVIHAVGPRMGDGDEEATLTRTVANALLRAHENGWRSLSFPAISSGIFSVPEEVCARAYVQGVRKHFEDHPGSSLEEVRLCMFESPLVARVEEEIDRVF